jgi:hypothetical protein
MGIDEGPRVIREKRFATGESGGADQEAAVEAELAGDVEQVAFDPQAGAAAFMQGDPELHDEAGLAAVVVGVGRHAGEGRSFAGGMVGCKPGVRGDLWPGLERHGGSTEFEPC